MVFPHHVTTKNSQETAALGQELATFITGGGGGERLPNVICLFGELGSGKTTFAQGFAKGLGIRSRLLSPTFIIVRRYEIPNNGKFFYHIDLYRMETGQLEGLGISEIFSNPDAVVAIEWAQKAESLLPTRRIDVHFEAREDGSHTILLEKVG